MVLDDESVEAPGVVPDPGAPVSEGRPENVFDASLGCCVIVGLTADELERDANGSRGIRDGSAIFRTGDSKLRVHIWCGDGYGA